ncbi:M48 family metallopeptidase [Parafannyhessea umbonata]|uniref:OmpA-like domain-containing protein n=1 Tax=Parafannyhessea umbonata TaxID=604330 RepID=A0A1H9NVH0_9ACTN|nr:SprT family zinc-dependent metalloprotease [Parafannyhessea umbonata]SER39908.1 hypothetical protein SAMN05216446_0614 [Parafannyhessea umbonata]
MGETVAIGELEVEVRRARVRRVTLRIAPDGSVRVTAPNECPIQDIEAFVRDKATWAESRREGVLRARREELAMWSDGGCVEYLGEELTLSVERDAATHAAQFAERSGERIIVHLADFTTSEEVTGQTQALVEAWLEERMEELLPGLFAKIERRMQLRCSGWRIRRMKSRWGSCNTKTRMICLNAQLVEYPIECLESVIAHELCHLIEPTHNERFHQLLDTYYPANREARRILNLRPPRR